MVARFTAYRDTAEREWERVGIEEGFRVEVGRAVVAGRVDRIERDAEGRLRIVDLKTGKTKPTEAELDRHGQLGAYQVAVEEGGFPGLGEHSAGAALVFIGKGGPQRAQAERQDAAAARAQRRPHVGPHARRADGRGHGRPRLPRRPGQGVRDVPRALVVPRAARG